MLPQGSLPINLEQMANLTHAVDSAASCEELQELVGGISESLAATQAAIALELAALNPMLALLAPPTSPAKLITWAADMITLLITPMIKPTITYAAQLAELSVAIASLSSAISSASGKFPSCSVSFP